VEVTNLPEVCAVMNENFVSAVVDGTLVMVGGSIDLAALQASAADSGADILPAELDVQRAACAVSKKWWHSFGCNYVLVAIQARLCKVNVHA
jgi:hypothetical protein